MKYLVTGAAGFIGMHSCLKLLKKNFNVIGIDNLNSYYDVNLKLARLKILKDYKNFRFLKVDIRDKNKVSAIFKKFSPSHVLHFAAQAGVRYSIKNPEIYTTSNLLGFSNILESSRKKKIKHLILASSSSVYGGNTKFPFNESDNVDRPISFYAATKKSNELMAHAYSHLFNIPTTCLRFFTVYGPWGRPDMSLFLFTKAIKNNFPIKIFNKGKMFRDFTYVNDVADAVYRISKKPPRSPKKINKKFLKSNLSFAPYKIFNIGSNKPINLNKYIKIIEKAVNKKAKKKYLPMQQGELRYTHADLKNIKSWINFNPKTNITKGIKEFVEWYNNYYG